MQRDNADSDYDCDADDDSPAGNTMREKADEHNNDDSNDDCDDDAPAANDLNNEAEIAAEFCDKGGSLQHARTHVNHINHTQVNHLNPNSAP